MNLLRNLALCLLLLSAARGALADTGFFQAIADLPLMPGMQELPGTSAIFETPQGRIVEARAQANAQSPASIRRFYRETLPQLGWQMTGDMTFARGDEHLTISLEPPPTPAQAGLIVDFLLVPLAGKGQPKS